MSQIEIPSKVTLRWLVRRNKVNANAVVAYRDKNDCSLSEAKRILVDAHAPVLQQMIIEGGQQVWITVPTVIVPTSEETP